MGTCASATAPCCSFDLQAMNKDNFDTRKMNKDENADFEATMFFLNQVHLFRLLPKDQHPLLAQACISQSFVQGEEVIRQGEIGDAFYIIRSGEATVLSSSDGGEPQRVAKLQKGDYFGENALLRDEPRMATVVAETSLATFKITRKQFQDLNLHNKVQFVKRKAVGHGEDGEVATKPASPKKPDERKLISDALNNNESLQTMVSLDQANIQQIVDVAWKESVDAGTDVIVEGDLQADYFYVIQEGSFEVIITNPEEKTNAMSAEGKMQGHHSEQSVSSLGRGASFGELALLYLVPRAATVRANVRSVVWVIDRRSFKNILMKKSQQKVDEFTGYLDNVQILAPLVREEKGTLAEALVEMRYERGDIIVQQGEKGSAFYILIDGTVKVIKDGKDSGELSASRKHKKAEYFGEKALLQNEPRDATVRVCSETARVLVLDKETFEMILGPLEDLIKLTSETRSTGDKMSRCSMARMPLKELQSCLQARWAQPRERIERVDLSKIGLLGCGGFGAVELYEHKKSGQSFAMKALSKGYIVKTGMQQSVINEKNILMATDSPFIIKLFATYNSAQSLYFLLEPALGGELYATYNRKGFHGNTNHAKFYSSGVVFSFEHLHERRVAYRDLKPENLLLNEKGQIKLTDMGLAKFVIGRTFTTCGTPDYFAPELIASTGHTNAVDWWTLGILIFELMSGNPPFEAPNPMQIYSKVMKGIGRVRFPQRCQGAVGELIKSLLSQEPATRLPMKPGGVKLLKEHAWYQGFDWAAMKNLTLTPPYVPVVKSKTDIANFNARKEDMPRQLQYKDTGTGWDKDFES